MIEEVCQRVQALEFLSLVFGGEMEARTSDHEETTGLRCMLYAYVVFDAFFFRKEDAESHSWF